MEVPTKFELELKPEQATLLKNILESLSDMFSKADIDFSDKGFELQAIDTSEVVLVALFLRAEALQNYRCACDLSVGLNIADMAEVFRLANNDDKITIKAEDDFSETVTFALESPADCVISNFDFDFLDVDDVPLEAPEPVESDYQAIVRMPSAKFTRICKKLSSFRDSDSGVRDTGVKISVYKDRVWFYAPGENVASSIVCRQTQTDGKPKEPALIIEMKEEVSLNVSRRLMNSFSKLSTLSAQVAIFLSSEKGKLAVFEYKIAGMGYSRYYMFPDTEVQNEEDVMQN